SINVDCYTLFFFFSSRRRHTRFSRDWSSDVCSSDLEEELNLKDNNVVRLKLELEKNIRDIELDDRIKDLQVQNFEALLSDAQRLLEIGGSTQEEVEKARQNLAIARLEKHKLENELEYRKASIESDVLNEKIQSSIQEKRLVEIQKKIELA